MMKILHLSLSISLILLTAISTRADLVVSGGYVTVTGGSVREHARTDIQSGATVLLASGTEWISPDVLIQSGGILQGCGTVTGSLVNKGLILADCGTGSTLTLAGDVDNQADGVIRAENDTAIVFGASFIHNGILDLIFSPGDPPSPDGGTGDIVTAATLPPIGIQPFVGNLSFRIYSGHVYQVQFTDDLAADPVIWTDLGSPLTTPSDVAIQTIPMNPPASGQRMYRYRIQ